MRRPSSGSSTPRCASKPWQFAAENTWRTGIAKKIDENRATTQVMFDDDSVPMNYYRVAPRDPRRPPARRHHLQRGREHDGHRPHGAAELPPASPPRRRQLRHDGRRSRVRHRGAGRATPASASSPSRATRRSASAAWRWRSPAATRCPSRSSSSTTTASAAARARSIDRDRCSRRRYVPQARYETRDRGVWRRRLLRRDAGGAAPDAGEGVREQQAERR